ncbi:MAG: HEPN domain-containing protein [Lachnospiraceae bacterium]|nr:HEPN domain-containing protein [Lachnospiraceae bacterium]
MKPHDDFDVGSRTDIVIHRIRVAKEDLATAQLLVEAEQYRGANNRAYYAIYHAIDAVLAIEGKAFKRHKDTLGYFNKNYVATNIFPRDLGRRVVKAEEIRHASDYDTFYIASKEVTLQQVETAEQLIALVCDYFEEHREQID